MQIEFSKTKRTKSKRMTKLAEQFGPSHAGEGSSSLVLNPVYWRRSYSRREGSINLVLNPVYWRYSYSFFPMIVLYLIF